MTTANWLRKKASYFPVVDLHYGCSQESFKTIAIMKRFILFCAVIGLAAFTCFAADANASGVWKWSLSEQTGETILKVKQEGDKLTGSYTNQFGAAEIKDGSVKDGNVTFKVKREFNGTRIQWAGIRN
jgi:hypothetical protein